jgi:LacI family transcriptional regulator, galactose operon repressor
MQPQRARSNPTIKDVAKYAGVSIATVSRVLNKTGSVQNDTAIRVFAAVEALKYHPNAVARILARKQTETIGLLLPIISGDFFAEMLQGIENGVVEAGYDLLIHTTFAAVNPRPFIKHVLGEHNTDGLIVFTSSLDEDELHRLYDIGLPMVLLHRSPPQGLNIPYITVENKNGTCSVVEHLIEVHGKRRIVFLRGLQDQEDSAWRELGYRQALERHGIPFDPDLTETGNYSHQDSQVAMKRLIDRGVSFDAVFAGNDEAASGVLATLLVEGFLVPQDIALAGFDNSNLALYLSPPLTTINAHIQQVGYAAAQQLVRLIQTGQADPITLLPTELVIRRSCGCGS